MRLAADADRLGSESEEQRATIQRMRAELEKAIEDTLAAAHAEVDAHAVERRRALHELDERMRRRERELLERIEREEIEASARIRAGSRTCSASRSSRCSGSSSAPPRRTRTTPRSSSPGSSSRAARMRHAVCRESSTARSRCSRARRRQCSPSGSRMSAMRERNGSSAGSTRRPPRSSSAATSVSPRSTGDIAELEVDIRRRLEDLGADAEAERAVIEARLQELVRRVGSLDALQST